MPPNHDGSARDATDDLFEPPDAALGEVRSASTTARGERGFFGALRAQTCTYVGARGVARYTRRGKRAQAEVVTFSDCAELEIQRKAKQQGHMWIGGSFRYDFRDLEGKSRFAIEGSFERGALPAWHPLRFAEAAERAWSEHVREKHEGEIAAHGAVHFAIDGRTELRVGPGFVEVQVGERRERLDASEIDTVTIARGWLEIRSRAGGPDMRGQGVFRFKATSPAELRRLAAVLQHVGGVSVG